MIERTIAFIGAGKVATALAYLLKNRGYRVTGISSRSIESAEKAATFMGGTLPCSNDLYVFAEDADIVFITTNDDAIGLVAKGVAENCTIRPDQVFIHTSGSLTSATLVPIEEKGGLCISLHPLQTVANPVEGTQNIIGSLFAIEGNEKAHPVALEFVKALDGIPFFIDKDQKPLYHLSAVIACNYLVTLIATSLKILKSINIDEKVALAGILKLVRGTVTNLDRLGPVGALTGPIARGDEETIKDHVQALKTYMPEVSVLYKALGEQTTELAIEKGGIDRDKARKIREILSPLLTK